jgi:hypothetical protein
MEIAKPDPDARGTTETTLAILGDKLVRSGSTAFSPAARRFAYVDMAGGKQWVVLDGEPEPAYTKIVPRSLRFNRDGTRLAYGAQVQKLLSLRNLLVDGDEETQLPGALNPVDLDYGCDGERLACFTESAMLQARVHYGEASRPVEKPYGFLLTSPSTHAVAYRAGKKVVLWETDRPAAEEYVDFRVFQDRDGEILTLAFSPDGRRILYLAGTGTQLPGLLVNPDMVHMVNGTRLDDRVGADARLVFNSPRFLDDGRLAYLCVEGEALVLRSETGPEVRLPTRYQPGRPFRGFSLDCSPTLDRVRWIEPTADNTSAAWGLAGRESDDYDGAELAKESIRHRAHAFFHSGDSPAPRSSRSGASSASSWSTAPRTRRATASSWATSSASAPAARTWRTPPGMGTGSGWSWTAGPAASTTAS